MIQQYQSQRPNVGVIYSGLVAHHAKVSPSDWYKNFVPSSMSEPEKVANKRLDELRVPVKRFFDEIVADPTHFIENYGTPNREIYTGKELNAYFCNWFEGDGQYKNLLSELCPRDYFAANGYPIKVSKTKGVYLISARMIAVKNLYMWHTASIGDCAAHVRRHLVK